MTLILTQSLSAVGPLKTSSFLAAGGTEPYLYSVLPGGAGGTINATTGIYTAPALVPTNPAQQFDVVQVEDYASVMASLPIMVGSPLLLFCDVLQKGLGLADGRVYLWDQKIMQPTDSGLYIAVSVVSCKPFANVNRQATSGTNQEQYVSMMATLDLDIISRGPAARDRKEEVIIALNNQYAQQQQEANGFYISKLPPSGRFFNLSDVDGAAIPYRYKISVNLQYAFAKNSAIDYFDDFSLEETVDP